MELQFKSNQVKAHLVEHLLMGGGVGELGGDIGAELGRFYFCWGSVVSLRTVSSRVSMTEYWLVI